MILVLKEAQEILGFDLTFDTICLAVGTGGTMIG